MLIICFACVDQNHRISLTYLDIFVTSLRLNNLSVRACYMSEFLGSPIWQGVGAIAGIISIIISLWQARQSRSSRKKVTTNQNYIVQKHTWIYRIVLFFFSLVIPTYAIFVGSILLVNIFTTESEQITYSSVILASVLNLLWGIVWANYIQGVFQKMELNADNHKVKPKKGRNS